MKRFNNDFRNRFPNQVCSHFAKYSQYIHPLTFDPDEVAYRPVWTDEQWEAVTLLSSPDKGLPEIIKTDCKFRVIVSERGKKSWESSWIEFYHTWTDPRGNNNWPDRSIHIDDLPEKEREIIKAWGNKAAAFDELRQHLWGLVRNLIDWGWIDRKTYRPSSGWGGNGSWVGGPTKGQGVNTAGQMQRIWPELAMFLPNEYASELTDQQVKSRLPAFIDGWGKPEMFMLQERPYHSCYFDEDTQELDLNNPYTDEEWETEKRKREVLNQILVAASLMKQTPAVIHYPRLG